MDRLRPLLPDLLRARHRGAGRGAIERAPLVIVSRRHAGLARHRRRSARYPRQPNAARQRRPLARAGPGARSVAARPSSLVGVHGERRHGLSALLAGPSSGRGSDVSRKIRADSLDVVELVMALEEEFGIEVPDDDVENIRTVGDIVQYLEARASA